MSGLFGGKGVKVPELPKTFIKLQAAQFKLLSEQAAITRQASRQSNALSNFFAEQAGLVKTVTKNKKGQKVISYDLSPEAKAEQEQAHNIQQMLNERTMAALKGELPVDPALERELTSKEQTLRERLQAQFGPGYETSTPGIQTLDEFFRSSEGLRYSARRDQLTLAEQLGLANKEGINSSNAMMANLTRASTIGDPLQVGAGFGSTAAGVGQGLIPYIQQQQLGLNASIANAQLQGQQGAGIGNLLGTVFGAVFPGFGVK